MRHLRTLHKLNPVWIYSGAGISLIGLSSLMALEQQQSNQPLWFFIKDLSLIIIALLALVLNLVKEEYASFFWEHDDGLPLQTNRGNLCFRLRVKKSKTPQVHVASVKVLTLKLVDLENGKKLSLDDAPTFPLRRKDRLKTDDRFDIYLLQPEKAPRTLNVKAELHVEVVVTYIPVLKSRRKTVLRIPFEHVLERKTTREDFER